MLYKVALNATNKLSLLVQVLASGAGIPGGYTQIGTFEHEGTDPLGTEANHDLFTHVRDALFGLGYLDTQIVHITWPGKIVATAVTIGPKNISAGNELQLTAVTTPAAISRGRLKWSTANDKVASITPRGVLLGYAPGVTKGRAQVVDGGAYAEFDIEVFADYVPVTSVSIAPGATSKVIAQTQQYVATVLPAGASNKDVVWTSTDPTKATVSATGLATAVAVGSTTIRATTVDGAFVGSSVLTVTAS